MKKVIVAVIIVAVLAYVGIVSTNNRIAEGLQKQLKDCMLPPGTELVDSIAVKGKMDGSDMQHFGAALIHSDLDEGPLRVWYEAQLPNAKDILISRQETPVLFEGQKPRFKDFEDDGHYWRVMLGQ